MFVPVGKYNFLRGSKYWPIISFVSHHIILFLSTTVIGQKLESLRPMVFPKLGPDSQIFKKAFSALKRPKCFNYRFIASFGWVPLRMLASFTIGIEIIKSAFGSFNQTTAEWEMIYLFPNFTISLLLNWEIYNKKRKL